MSADSPAPADRAAGATTGRHRSQAVDPMKEIEEAADLATRGRAMQVVVNRGITSAPHLRATRPVEVIE